MIDINTLSPREAAYIAHNSYFTLKDWVKGSPTAGMEKTSTVKRMVTGNGVASGMKPGDGNTSLRSTDLKGANLDSVFRGETAGLSTGFGYVLSFRRNGLNQVVIASRGTRVEHSYADGLADLHAAITTFGGYGQVHAGFANAFASIVPNLARQESLIRDADLVHCVGHSLGGAISTLVAAHYAGSRGVGVKLYTFGSPRVGAHATPQAFESLIGKDNIYRVSHDLDPVAMVGPYPYSHVNGLASDSNNMMLRSPTAKLIGVANHDMRRYVESVSDAARDLSWQDVRGFSAEVIHDNAVLARWLLRSVDNPSFITTRLVEGLSVILKAFSHFLQMQSVTSAIISGMTAIDLFSAALSRGIDRVVANNPQLLAGLQVAAVWARVSVIGAKFTAAAIRAIMTRMMDVIRPLMQEALAKVGAGNPLPLVIAGASAMVGSVIA
jgi:pimeloyl-ACP methyl ester carboxylesterase